MEMARFLAIFLIVFAHTASAQTETQARAAGTNVTESSGIKSPASGDDHEQSDGDPGSRKGGRGAQCDR
jgi:hypothetical protein